MKKVLCADIGTSSLKTAVIDETGHVLAGKRVGFKKSFGDFASLEWIEALKSALDSIFTPDDSPSDEKKSSIIQCEITCGSWTVDSVDAICISGNGPTIVSENGRTLLWNHPVDETVLRSVDTKSLFIPRLAAFRNLFPEDWSSASHVFSGPEFLIYQLTGNPCTILPEKRYREAYWSCESLVKSSFTEDEIKKLPPFVFSSDMAGKLTKDAENLLNHAGNGFCEGLPVYCGAPDFISALVGTGSLFPGALCDRAGSSEGLNLCTENPIRAEGIRTLPSVVPGLWNASVLIGETGTRFERYKESFEKTAGFTVSYEDLVHAALESDGSQAILDQGKYLMLQTAMEARDAFNLLARHARESGEKIPGFFTVSGGQASNREWMEVKCNVMGIPAKIPLFPDAELIGDAAFAFTRMGLFPDLQTASKNLSRIKETILPEVELRIES